MQQVWVSGGGDIDAGTRVTVTATTNPGYLFIGWCEGDDIVSVDKDYTFTMPDGVRVLEARWVLGRYTVTFNSNGGSEVASITELYTNAIEAPTPPTRTGYTFAGWYSNAGLTSEYAFNTMPAENITVYAKWTKNRHNVNLSKNILAAGTVSENVVNAEYGTSVTVTASTKTGYTFDGWYEGETRVSTDASWTFYMPAAHKNYEARWTVYQRVDSEGVRSDSGAYILFGYYPQTRARVVSPSLSATTGNMGELEYTLGIDGVTRYVKVNSGGTDYYYEVEPIKWRILNYITLAADGNKALILSEKVLTRKAWHTDTTSNKNDVSMIRAWLNDGLYNTTFSTQQKGLIEQTMVDNSGGTTGYGSGNINACGNTYDNIFLLSWSQVMNSAYGFSSDEPRKKVLTDYSRKLGTKEVNGFAHWWLRSPYHSGTSQVRYIDEDGYIGDKDTVTTSSLGVVPALVIDLT